MELSLHRQIAQGHTFTHTHSLPSPLSLSLSLFLSPSLSPSLLLLRAVSNRDLELGLRQQIAHSRAFFCFLLCRGVVLEPGLRQQIAQGRAFGCCCFEVWFGAWSAPADRPGPHRHTRLCVKCHVVAWSMVCASRSPKATRTHAYAHTFVALCAVLERGSELDLCQQIAQGHTRIIYFYMSVFCFVCRVRSWLGAWFAPADRPWPRACVCRCFKVWLWSLVCAGRSPKAAHIHTLVRPVFTNG